MANWYYYDANGYKMGPVTGGQLKGLAKTGRITPETVIETEEGKKSVARKVSGLTFVEAMQSVPPPLPIPDASPFAVQTPVQPVAPSSPPRSFEKFDHKPSRVVARRSTGSGCFDWTMSEHQRIIQYFAIGEGDGCLKRPTHGITDDSYDRMVMDKVNGLGLKHKAIEQIGLDIDQLKEIPPIFLHGYSFESIEVGGPNANALVNKLAGNISPTYSRFGSDGRLRTSKYDATWLFFIDAQIYMYKYTMDMASDSMKETIREYFYKDITNFSTEFQSVSPPQQSGLQAQVSGCLFGPPKIRESNVFLLVVPNDMFACSISGVADAERSIFAMKQLMREKKG